MNELTDVRHTAARSAAFESLAELLEPGVLVIRAGRVVFADDTARALLGGEPEAIWPEVERRIGWTGTGGERRGTVAVPAEGAEAPEAGARRLGVAARQVPAGSGEETLVLISDAGAVDALEADLRAAAQMRSTARISPAVAHDLRAPINAMVFNLEILKELLAGATQAGSERQLRYLGILKEELNRLHRSLEIFLAQTGGRADKRETFDLRELVTEVAALVTPQARKQQAKVAADLPEAAVPVEGSRHLLKQALLNVALETLEATPRGADLAASLRKDSDRATLRIAPANGGAGEAERTAHEPAFALRLSPSGTVAGLYVARSILGTHGGDLRAAGGGAGCGFEIELPVSGKEQ